MAKCLNEGCSNEVVNKEGKRARRTCSDSCRQKLWQKNNTKQRFIKVPIDEWELLMSERVSASMSRLPETRTTPLFFKEKEEGRRPTGNPEQKAFLDGLMEEKIFRPRRDDESGMDYRIATEEWRMNNQ